MTEQSDDVKKWLTRNDRLQSKADIQRFNNKSNVEKVVQTYCGILFNIEADYRAKLDGEVFHRLTYHDEDIDKFRKTKISRSNPSNHEAINEDQFAQIRNKLKNARELAIYPQKIIENFCQENSAHLVQSVYPKVENAAI